MSAARILTTTVGSYPVPDWLIAAPSEQALVDATRVVIDTQQQAGIDLVCDGELYRFDINHPETNGMIEYFVRPLVRRAQRDRPAGLARLQELAGSQIPRAAARGGRSGDRAGLARSAGGLRARQEAHHAAAEVHAHRPAHADENAARHALPRQGRARMAIADVLAEQVKHIDAAVVQVDEANLPGAPHEWEWAAEAINRVLRAVRTTPAVHLCFGNYGGQSMQKGSWGQLMNYLNALHVDHIVMENAHRPAEELAVFKELRPEIGFGLGVVDIKRTEDRVGRRDRARDRACRQGAGRGPREIHPSRLRLLDAQARHRGRKDPRAGEGQGPLRRTALSGAVTSRYNGARQGGIFDALARRKHR